MENNPDNSHGGWPADNGQQQPTISFVTTSSAYDQQPEVPGIVQAQSLQSLQEGQFHAYSAANFQPVFQAPADSGYEADFTGADTDGETLQLLHNGRTHLITVPLLMTSQASSMSNTGDSVSSTTQLAMSLVASSNNHNIQPVGQHTIAHLPTGGRDQSLSSAQLNSHAHLYQVIPLAQPDQPSSSTVNLLTQPGPSNHPNHGASNPLHRLALPHNIVPTNKAFSGTFANEPDTTQEDVPTYVDLTRVNSYVGEATPIVLTPQSSEMNRAHSSGMDSNQHHQPTMDSTMDSTVEDSALDPMKPNSDEESEEEENMSIEGQPGAEADLQQLLANAEPGPSMSSGTSVLHSLEDTCPDRPESELSSEVIQNVHHLLTQAPTRKSERIAKKERSPSPVPRPKYTPRPYNVQELWCEECQTTYPTECPEHKIQTVYDKVVLSRAWATLPPQLQIFRLGDTTDLGVFSKKAFPKRTQFGPFSAELLNSKEELTVKSHPFLLEVDREEGKMYLEATDENKCNWMMFVRPAQNYAEQNLIAYQFGNDVYFSTMKNIEPKQELKVWYAAHYAERIGVAVHEMSETDLEALDAAELKWPCYECNKKFKTSAQLQKHLVVHDEVPADVGEISSGDEGEKKPGQRPNGRRRLKNQSKKIRELVGGDGAAFQSWKKRTTRQFLNKMKKYRNPIKRSIKTLYKKNKEVNEWVCTHCQLTFDNPSLLNLHTLAHAAEDVDMEDGKKSEIIGGNGDAGVPDALSVAATAGQQQATQLINGTTGDQMIEPMFLISGSGIRLDCPVCHHQFQSKQELIQHASEHGRMRRRTLSNPNKPFKCNKCWKGFTVEEKLQRHLLCHGDESTKPMECVYCNKRFMNNSALACHLKTHSDKKYYECPMCREGFDQMHALKDHVQTHRVNGFLNCTDCHKTFSEYHAIRKHIRAFHSENKCPCPECGKIFPRPDKLKMHMLCHTNLREYMCETCGRQFKRKDKLKEHTKRMHNPEREARLKVLALRKEESKKFIPKVSPSDYHRFIYKCHSCLLGFKRRGMLVNHLAKRHPDVKPDSVPELNLPILRTQRDYFCQYCQKVYKSSSKRKAHIIKNHPGAELPPSARRMTDLCEIPGIPNSTYSSPAGSVTTVPQSCQFCHKQYASKAKLLQHQRKKHSEHVAPAQRIRRISHSANNAFQMVNNDMLEDNARAQVMALSEKADNTIDVMGGAGAVQLHTLQQVDTAQQADILTQAMSELVASSQNINDFRTGQHVELQLANNAQRILQPTATIVQNSGQHTTIELSHLGQALAQSTFQPEQQQHEQPDQGHVPQLTQLQQVALTGTGNMGLTNQSLGSVQAIVMNGNQSQNGSETTMTIPVSMLPRSWTAGNFTIKQNQ